MGGTPRLAANERRVSVEPGRAVGFAEWGDPAGFPVFAHHGTPACRLAFDWTHDRARVLGVRILAPDRPGIGISDASTFTPATVARDVAALATALSIERYGVLGWSGGGPFAIASAFVDPARVAGAVIASGVGDVARDGHLGSLNFIDRTAYRLALRAPWALRPMFSAGAWAMSRFPGLAMRTAEGELSPTDRRAWAKVDSRAPRERMGFFLGAFARGSRGVVEDYRALARPFDFLPDDSRVPVHLWQGTDDRMVPMAHVTALTARIPWAKLHPVEGEGHCLLYDRFEELLAPFLEGRGSAASLTGQGQVGS